MAKRFLVLWFSHLVTDWLVTRQPDLARLPLVLAAKDHGRMIITATNLSAEKQGVRKGMPVADARVLAAGLQVLEDLPEKPAGLLSAIGLWCIRYTPVVAPDLPDGLILDISGCAHLWGGEKAYLKDLVSRLNTKGYQVRAAIADTIGTAWAHARYGQTDPVIAIGYQLEALRPLPPAALRLEAPVLDRLQKLGFHHIDRLINLPHQVLRRRFGEHFLLRLGQALGTAAEPVIPLCVIPPYQERLACLDPVCTATGITLAVGKLLDRLCGRLAKEGKGLRTARLQCYRVDGKMVEVAIGTNRASRQVAHLLQLFELKIPAIEPALGIELFVLDAGKVEDLSSGQEVLWAAGQQGMDDPKLAALLDRFTGKFGDGVIHRYLPQEHYWPERSCKPGTLQDRATTAWRSDRPRPLTILPQPHLIRVTAPVPDYPPMLFMYKGERHQVKKADGPERIEREWWLDSGEHRDYYVVEDAEGRRYWLFRSGHYSADRPPQWFIHGFFS